MNSEMILWRNMLSQTPRRHRAPRRALSLRGLRSRLAGLFDLGSPGPADGGPA